MRWRSGCWVIRWRNTGLCLLLALLTVSCHQAPPTNPHYVLGAPYQAGGVWYYPRESSDLTETGLAMVYPAGHPELTADGELFDQSAHAAAHQTLQLPVIARLTDLENGRQIVVRINDRGPATPHRLIEVTQRVASLLGFPADGVTRVKLEVLAAESEAVVGTVPGAPSLEIAKAPVGEVQTTDLPPPGSPASAVVTKAASPAVSASESRPVAEFHLPETVTQTTPEPGNLYVQLSTFQNFQYADMQRARVAGSGARIVDIPQGRTTTYRVIIGPLTTVEEADRVLDQVIGAGVTDARIVVE
jgi:rare lipoprotein A